MTRFNGILGDAERKLAIANERARVVRVVNKFLARPTPLELVPVSAAIAFFHESIHADLDTDDPTQTKVGRLILESSEKARCSILLAAVRALAQAPWEAPSWRVNVICDLRFVHDYRLGGLIKAILRTRPRVSDDELRIVVLALSDAASRFESNFPMNTYPFPFAALVRLVVKASPVHRDVIAPAVKQLIAAIRQAVARDLVALKGYSDLEADNLSATPARWFTKADREAIELIERWG